MTSGVSAPWWTNTGETHQFGTVLVEADALETPTMVLDYFDAPQKWRREYEVWISTGRPSDHTDAGWEEFCNDIG